MDNTILNAIIKLRRKNLSAYPADYRPAEGEVCLVDDNLNGLRIKVGDGLNTFAELPYLEASNEAIGMLKLYNSTGEKTDGTMTQKAISELIDSKTMSWGQLGSAINE